MSDEARDITQPGTLNDITFDGKVRTVVDDLKNVYNLVTGA